MALHANQGELVGGDYSGAVRVFDLTANRCSAELVSATFQYTSVWSLWFPFRYLTRFCHAAGAVSPTFSRPNATAVVSAGSRGRHPHQQRHSRSRRQPCGGSKLQRECIFLGVQNQRRVHANSQVTGAHKSIFTGPYRCYMIIQDFLVPKYRLLSVRLHFIGPPRTLQAHRNYLLAARLSPDVRLLATASADRTVKLWNTQDGSLITTLAGALDGYRGFGLARAGYLRLLLLSWD